MLQSFQKVYDHRNNFFEKNEKKNKNAEYHADFESVENLLKMRKKVISKTSLTNMSKSENSAYFRHVFANNFFACIFAKLFQRIRNHHETQRFFIPILNF